MIGALFFVVFSLSLMGAGEYYSKLWVNSHKPSHMLTSLACYWAGACLWFPALRSYSHLTTLGTIWDLGAVATTMFVGIWLCQEQISTSQWIGLGLAVVACWFLCH